MDIKLSKVAVVKGERGHEPVFRALDLIDYRDALKGWKRVLVKVNFITTKTWDTGATTDPVVVEAIIRKLKEIPVEVYVVESDATMTNADKAFEVTGMAEMCERNGVGWINLRHEEDRVELEVPDYLTLKTIKVPRIAVESAVISAAKLKTHSETMVTLGLKNMFGMLPAKFKGRYHVRGMHKVITDINSVLKPALTVIDGFTAMEGRGPVGGKPVKMDTIIAGSDVVATDATAAKVMGFDPMHVPHIRMAHERGIGDMEGVEVVGDGVDSVMKIFKRAF
jgi:uncharacterized protein (DUF362 family)